MKQQIILKSTVVFILGLLISCSIDSNSYSKDIKQKLEYIVFDFVKNDKSIKNSVLSVSNGDNSFSWSGAAGVASQQSQSPMTNDTPIYIASITKLYTATIIMKLYEDNRLSLDDPMSKYLPEKIIHNIHVYKGRNYSNEITIKQLLAHTSGIADYYSEKSKDGKNFFDIFLGDPERKWTVSDTIERARNDLKPKFSPGKDVSYSDTNYQLLGLIVESITHKPLNSIYEEIIFRPLSLKHTWLIGYSEDMNNINSSIADVFYKDEAIIQIRLNGSYWADGGIVSTAEEMIIFLKALNQGRIIKRSTIQLMHHWQKLHFPLKYGFGTMYFKLPQLIGNWMNLPPLWEHSGSTGSFLYYSEDLDLYLAGTINQGESESKPFFGLISKVIKAVQSNK